MSTKDCQYCADNTVCGIIFNNEVKSKVVKIEETTLFLDKTDFSLIDKNKLLKKINNMKSADLVEYIKTTAKTQDDVAVVEWIKRLVKETEGLSIKGGVCIYG